LALQSPVFGRGHHFFTGPDCRQCSLGIKPPPSKHLIRRDAVLPRHQQHRLPGARVSRAIRAFSSAGQRRLRNNHRIIGDFDQREIADQEGVQTLRQLADLLEKVLLTGSLRQQFIGWFGSSPARATAFLYAIGQNGDLFWFKQPGGADPAALAAWEGPKTVGSGWQECLF